VAARARILAVDDEPTIRRLIKTALESKGHEVVEAANGDEALYKASTEQFDLVILDIMMPGMTGHQLRDKLRQDERTKHLPIIFVSAVGEFQEQLHGLEEADDYLTKPFSPRDLANRVEAILDPSRKEELLKERNQEKARLHTLTEIMRKKREEG